MGKRIEKDPTMELSTSQLVAEPARGDASVWNQAIVGTDQFAPGAQPSAVRRWILITVGLVLLAAASAAIYLLVA